MNAEDTKKSAIAQIEDGNAFMLASVGTDGVLKFCVLIGTASEDAACATQCRGMAAAMDAVVTGQVIETVGYGDDGSGD